MPSAYADEKLFQNLQGDENRRGIVDVAVLHRRTDDCSEVAGRARLSKVNFVASGNFGRNNHPWFSPDNSA
jgi:hypothetical protein